LARPSELLLHYNCGIAVIKRWGRQAHLLSPSRRRIALRPSAPVIPGPAGPPSTVHNRAETIQKREHYAGSSKKRKRTGGPEGDQDGPDTGNVVVEAVDGSTGWDEDDWMLFFSASTEAACEPVSVAGLLKRSFHLVLTAGLVTFHMVKSLLLYSIRQVYVSQRDASAR
jgi:hypothetical protein